MRNTEHDRKTAAGAGYHRKALLVVLIIGGLQAPSHELHAAVGEGRVPSAAFTEPPARPAEWQVTIIDLGVLPGGFYSSAYAINDTGKIVGMAYDASFQLQTVQWLDGQISIIPSLPSAASVPEDMNDAGEITGTLAISHRVYVGIYWNSLNSPVELPPLPDGSPDHTRAHGINASGQIAGMGQEWSPNYYGHAAVWIRDSFQSDLGFMGGGHYSEAYGINDLGDVVGVAQIANTNQHAFVWQNGQFTDLSAWQGGGASSIAYSINNHGVIVGLNASVASVWRDGVVSALPMPPGVSEYAPALDINDAGDIIATGSKGYPFDVGVMWRNGEPIDLGVLPGGTISRVRRINQAGEVVGEANAADGYFHAVKWIVTQVGGLNCAAIRKFSAGCRDGKLRAKVVSTLPEGTALTILRNGSDAKTLTINGRGKGKVTWTGQSGEQVLTIVECPKTPQATAVCP